MTKRQAALLDRLEAWYGANEHQSVKEAAYALHLPLAAAQAVTVIGLQEGRLVLVGTAVYTRPWMEALLDKLYGELGNDLAPPARFREALQQSRQWTDFFAATAEELGWLEKEPGGWRLKERA